MEGNIGIKEIYGVIRRRHKVCLAIFFLFVIIFTMIAMLLPNIYMSTAMIQIEEQQIPTDYVKSTITAYAQQRLDSVTRQIMKYTQLQKLVQGYDLYPDMVLEGNISGAISKLRNSITIDPISTTEGNRVSTVAFMLSYEGKNPMIVQKVTDALSKLYLREELKSREKLASVTTNFLQKELDTLNEQVQIHEERISKFKSEHIGELPENVAFNMQNISRLEIELERITGRIRTLEDRKIYLKGQLANVEPLKPVQTESGKEVRNPKERLKGLRLELIRMQARFSDKHPDVRKIKAEIRKLESQVGQRDEVVEQIKALSEKKAKLAEIKGRLSPKHPDVISLTKEVRILSKKVDNMMSEKSMVEISEARPDNPAYINLMTQLVSAEASIKSSKEEESKISQSLQEFRDKISKAPTIEKEYNRLSMDLNNARQKYKEILDDLMTAQVAQQMEKQQKGEKFTILEHAYLPFKPSKPNRAAIILLGIVLGLGASLGTAAIQEKLDLSLKSEEELARLTGIPVLTSFSMVRGRNHTPGNGFANRAIRLIARLQKK